MSHAGAVTADSRQIRRVVVSRGMKTAYTETRHTGGEVEVRRDTQTAGVRILYVKVISR